MTTESIRDGLLKDKVETNETKSGKVVLQKKKLCLREKNHEGVEEPYLSRICVICQWKCTRINFATDGKTCQRKKHMTEMCFRNF